MLMNVETARVSTPSKFIVTHPHVDLDAATSVALLVLQGKGTLDDVRFLPANAEYLPWREEWCIVVDHPLGLKGKRSALAEIPGAVERLGSQLVDIVDRHDAGECTDEYSLSTMFGAIRSAASLDGLMGEEKDRNILAHWYRVIRGLASMARQKVRAVEAAPDVPIAQVGPYRFAHSPKSVPPGTHAVLCASGVSGMFYQSKDGIGISRFKEALSPDLRVLAPYLPGWFIHPEGFLACWGSQKAPTDQPPPPHTPQSMDELIRLAQSVFRLSVVTI